MGEAQNGAMIHRETIAAIVKGGMIVNEAIQQEIARRAHATRVGVQPSRVAESLGQIETPSGPVEAYLRHAVDAVVTDKNGSVLLIQRRHNPGAGKLALPGGFLDFGKKGTVERSSKAALRELAEETGLILPKGVRGTRLSGRVLDRPFDIRTTARDIPGTLIKAGDYFAVSTVPYHFQVEDLTKLPVKAGDDAKAAVIRKIADLKPDELGIDDHPGFIHAAATSARLIAGSGSGVGA
jgi:8-oxo-dGTP pyrophosphatase MutT (NUDIX family)